MSRPRERILANLEALYRESFARASESGDQAEMQRLDFEFRRDQLYLESILDVRDLGVAYRKAKGYSLTKTLDKVVVPVSMQADIDYHQILVPVTGSRISDEMMVLACQLATEKKSKSTVLAPR